DVAAAKKLSGVKSVITCAELPTRALSGLVKRDRPVLATGRVRDVGEPVAIVAAETAEEARLATRAIAVRYELLAPITDPVASLQPDAASLHQKGNVIEDVLVEHGDPDTTAEVVVAGEYELGMQDQAALGPEAGLAIPRQDGGVELHIATQWLHEDLRQIAPCLGLPESKVHLVLAGVGGAFGAREDVTLQIHLCLLALATGRPVRMVYGREESFYGHVHRHPARLWYAHGARRDGRLVFVRASIVLDGDNIVTDQTVDGSEPVANLITRCAALPDAAPPSGEDPVAMPGGVGNITRGEGVRRGTALAAGFKNVCYSHSFDDFSTARVRL